MVSTALIIVVAVVVLVLVGMGFEMSRTPPGIERECRVEGSRFTTRTRTVTSAPPDEAIRLVQTHWSWWDRARAEPMRELGDGLKEFYFHPIRCLNFIETPPVILVHFDRVERFAAGGACIHATVTGDFEAQAKYSARPSGTGTIIEMAWVDVEVRGILRFMPIALLAAMHGWRERIGVVGLRRRVEAGS